VAWAELTEVATDVGFKKTEQIDAIGACAARALHEGANGEIAAIFERSFYVVIGGQWICLVPHGGGAGPLNALCRAHDLGDIRNSVRVGDAVSIANKSINISGLIFPFESAAVWTPALPGMWDKGSVARGLTNFNRAISSRSLPQDGLAMRLRDAVPLNSNAVAKAAQGPLQSLRKIIAATLAGKASFDINSLVPLMGLGPGLTPSGDDAIGGALIALHLLGEDRARDTIWQKLSPHVAAATNDISHAHLEAAAEGLGHEAIHGIANALLTGNAAHLDEEIAAVYGIGHTSGWDALVGVVMTMNTWLEEQNAR
jgi:hypothetical protein